MDKKKKIKKVKITIFTAILLSIVFFLFDYICDYIFPSVEGRTLRFRIINAVIISVILSIFIVFSKSYKDRNRK